MPRALRRGGCARPGIRGKNGFGTVRRSLDLLVPHCCVSNEVRSGQVAAGDETDLVKRDFHST